MKNADKEQIVLKINQTMEEIEKTTSDMRRRDLQKHLRKLKLQYLDIVRKERYRK